MLTECVIRILHILLLHSKVQPTSWTFSWSVNDKVSWLYTSLTINKLEKQANQFQQISWINKQTSTAVFWIWTQTISIWNSRFVNRFICSCHTSCNTPRILLTYGYAFSPFLTHNSFLTEQSFHVTSIKTFKLPYNRLYINMCPIIFHTSTQTVNSGVTHIYLQTRYMTITLYTIEDLNDWSNWREIIN